MTRLPTIWARRSWENLPLALTVCLLAGVAVDRVFYHLPPADSAPYHERVRLAAETLPYNIGTWLGSEVPVPASATAMLHPNVIVSRSYRHVTTGRTCSFLLVQCQDARDLIGHYPPVCYVSSGWLLQDATAKDWQVGETSIPAMRYTFTSQRLEKGGELRIENFMVLPDGKFCRDMDGVERLAQDHRRKFFGAAQVQVITDPAINDEEREWLFRQFALAAKPLVDVIRGGVAQ